MRLEVVPDALTGTAARVRLAGQGLQAARDSLTVNADELLAGLPRELSGPVLECERSFAGGLDVLTAAYSEIAGALEQVAAAYLEQDSELLR